MQIDPTTPTSAQTPTPSLSSQASEEREAQFDTFLRLLTAQVQNQDPLQPIDSTQFVEQLATYSGLEQQIRTNELLEELLAEARGAIVPNESE